MAAMTVAKRGSGDAGAIKQRIVTAIGANKFDEEVLSYLASVVLHSKSLDDAAEFIGPFFLQPGYLASPEEVELLCKKVHPGLPSGSEADTIGQPAVKKLSSTVNFSKLATPASRDLWAEKTPESRAQIDEEMVKRAEEKLKERNEKRAAKEAFRQNQRMEREGIMLQIANYGNTNRQASDGLLTSKDIRAENFAMAYGKLELLANCTINIAYGRRYGLVGRNGCGKSTLLRHIARRQIPYSPRMSVLHVEQEVVGDDTIAINCVLAADVERERLLQQEQTLLSEGGSAAEIQRVQERLVEIDAYSAESRASAILTGLSFSEEMKQQPTRTFSGGWRMRIALARALLCRPDVLLLDEPTNHLDFHAVVWLERFLSNWNHTLVIVSHQRDFLNNVVTDVIHLHQHKLEYYRGNYDAFERVASERIKAVKSEYDAQALQKKHIQKFIDRFRYNAKRASLVQSRLKMLDKMVSLNPIVEEGAVFLPFPDPDPVSPPILQIVDVSFGFTSDKILFRNMHFSIDMDTRIALVGPNGSGKTTFLKLITGDLQPSRGTVLRNGKVRFGMFSQHFVDQLDLDVSPVEYFHRMYPTIPVQTFRTHLGKYGITGDTALQTLNTLSGGQKSRVVFASIAYKQPHILLLDEPSNHLDIETIEGLAQSLNTFQGGIVMVSHDQRLISLVCDEVWRVADNRVTKWPGDLVSYKKFLESATSE
ncbi:non-transporter ABC protein AbcF1 [Pelomyxa schiedti]|nr:non-transporter ABC protein AbcF1 [Pelomyxa schiedti]